MKSRTRIVSLALAWSFCALAPLVAAQRVATTAQALRASCTSGDSSSPVAIHAAQQNTPYLNLCDGHALAARFGAPSTAPTAAQPLTLTSGDFDEDGVPDLASGFSTGNSGLITVYRGNVDALWPYGAALRNGPPPAFLPNPRQFSLPEAPDFIAAGDFDADGHWDLITAHSGSNALYFLKGDGHGGFRPAQRVPLDGTVTAMITGEINRADGLADLIVAINTSGGPRVLVYESPGGALKSQPEIFKLPESATSLVLGHFDGTPMNDLAVAAGDTIVVIHGRDRKLSSSASERASVPPARITLQKFSSAVRALAGGNFTGAGPSVAALGSDGQVHILEHTLAEDSLLGRMIAAPAFQPSMQVARSGKAGQAATAGGATPPSLMARLEALRQSAKPDDEGPEWVEKDTVALPGGFAQRASRLVTARVTGSLEDDILVPDSDNNQLHIFSTVSATHHPGPMTAGRAATAVHMMLLNSLASESAPAAVLPMRLNKYGLQGLVLLQDGLSGPVTMQQSIPASNIFTVTNTSDAIIASTQPTQYTGPAGSLRAAIYNANNATGPAEIDFNIPTSDPGYNSSTGTFLIQPLSENVPSSLDYHALPSVYQTTTIDGYTQPGASPNTSATSDNAKILIRIDGAKATTPGGSGFTPFDDANSTFRGFDLTGWTNPVVSNGTASGAMGIEAQGVGDYIEGNFIGTDPTGTLATDSNTSVSYGNRIGIFVDAGPALGNMDGGNIIGGTTPQARNILSNNVTGGILFLSIAYEAHLEGNFIGLDASGAKALGNVDDGAGSNGPTITIGGTLPGDGNVISGNGTDIDFNDLTNGGAASDSIAQGNLIGTDATGALSVSRGSGTGASILSGPTDETIGGTTPAARNVISGNYYGVYIFNDTTGNVIQGNFIGTDVTGTVAIGNSQQGFLQGATDSTSVAATNTVLGGSVAGAGNLISGNTLDGISISGTAPGGPYDTNQGSSILGNYVGTDVSGTKALGNGGSGISLLTGATNNAIGGTGPGSGNIIAYNKSDGVLIDAAATGEGTGNNTIGNVILSNTGAGVRVNSGTQNTISQNSIYQNGALGIVLGAVGPPLANQACSSTATGANNLENYPTLTGGSGSLFITATATDPNGNTSEFSNAVQESTSGSLLNLVGSFIGNQPSTAYTLEFFSSTTADPSGFGQGQTYLGSAQVTTGSNCTIAINNPVNPSGADLSITLSNADYELQTGPDFGGQVYTAAVQNLGPATAHNVVVTDVLPSSLEFSSLYCNVGPCQTSVTTSVGACTASGQTVTCDLGTMAAGQTATVNIPVEAQTAGSISDTATVTATETDPVPANNTSTVTETATYPEPFIDFPGNGTVPNFVPNSAIAGSPNLPLTIYGTGFIPSSSVSFNGTTLPTVSFADNQTCGYFQTYYCAAIEVVVPASLLTTAGTPNISVTNPDPGPGNQPNVASVAPFTIASACTFSITPSPDFSDGLENDGTTLIAENVSVAANAASCSWTASSSVSWVVPLESTPITGQYGSIDFAVAPNSGSASRSGSITVAGQTVEFTQAGASACDYALGNTSANFTPAGGAGSIDVTPNGSDCAPFVVSFAPWITIPSSSGLLLNNQPASFTVSANTGAPRVGTIMIGGYVFTVNQAAPPCYYTLSPGTALWGTAGGAGSFGVAASSPTCAWTATSSDTSVASVTSGASGTGNGTVNYSVAANSNGPQTATITVADTNGGSSAFSISQASNYTCTFTIAPSPVEVAADGTSNFFTVTASNSFCQWTATSSNPSALSITLNSSGTGTGTIYYAVGQNTGGPRTLTITAGCQTFTVNQDGAESSNPVPTLTSLQPSGVTAGSGALSLTVNGANFVNGAVVNFNNNARTTTFVSATQLTAAVLASDVMTAGTPSVTVTNPTPGGGTSNALTFNITAPKITPTVTVSPSPTSITTAQALSVTVTVNGGSGNPTPTGSVVLTSGTYTSAAATLTAGASTINISAGTLAAGTDTLTASFTPDSSSLATYNSSSGTNSVVVSAATVQVTVGTSPAGLSFSVDSTAYTSTQTLTWNVGSSHTIATTSPQNSGGTQNTFATWSDAGAISHSVTAPSAAASYTATFTTSYQLTTAVSPANSGTVTPASGAFYAAGTQVNLAATPNSGYTFTNWTGNVASSSSASTSVTMSAPESVTANFSAVAAPSFTMSSATGTQTIQPGGSAQFTITATAQNGSFSNAVTLAASGLPTGATALFSPAAITPGSSSASSTLTIQTASTTAMNRNATWPLAAGTLPLLGLLFTTRKLRQRWLALVVVLFASLGVMTALSGCGGGFGLTASSTAQTYIITVTGTSGAAQQTTTVHLTVQ